MPPVQSNWWKHLVPETGTVSSNCLLMILLLMFISSFIIKKKLLSFIFSLQQESILDGVRICFHKLSLKLNCNSVYIQICTHACNIFPNILIEFIYIFDMKNSHILQSNLSRKELRHQASFWSTIHHFFIRNYHFAWATIFLLFPEIEPEMFLTLS